MTADLINQALADVFMVEGVFSNDFDDPGNWTGGKVGVGELRGTKYGISAAAYPHLDLKSLTLKQAGDIYITDFWERMRCGEMAEKYPQVAVMVFNLAINCGRSNAGKMLQRAINNLNFVEGISIPPARQSAWQQAIWRLVGGKPLKVDGAVGPLTLSCLKQIPYPQALATGVFGEAYNHYIKGKIIYRAGWLNRIGKLYLKTE